MGAAPRRRATRYSSWRSCRNRARQPRYGFRVEVVAIDVRGLRVGGVRVAVGPDQLGQVDVLGARGRVERGWVARKRNRVKRVIASEVARKFHYSEAAEKRVVFIPRGN